MSKFFIPLAIATLIGATAYGVKVLLKELETNVDNLF